MNYNDIWANREFISQMEAIQGAANLVNGSAIQEALNIANSPVMQQIHQNIGIVERAIEQIQPVLPQYAETIQSVTAGLQNFSPMQEFAESYQGAAKAIIGFSDYFKGNDFKTAIDALSNPPFMNSISEWSRQWSEQQNLVMQSVAGIAQALDMSSISGIAAAINPLLDNYQMYVDAYHQLQRNFAEDIFNVDDDLEDSEIKINEDGSFSIDGEIYTSEEVFEIAAEQSQDISRATFHETISIEELKKRFKIFFFIINILFFIANMYNCYDTCKEIVQKVISKCNGWEDLYCISNENGASIYQEPSTDSEVIHRASYSNAILKTEDKKMWVKVQYNDGQNNLIEGWIAKRNLIPYTDIQFDSDEAVCGE